MADPGAERGDLEEVLALASRAASDYLAGIDEQPVGPPGAYVHRMEWSGTEEGGPTPFRLSIDGDAENGAATLITASYGDVPVRSLAVVTVIAPSY